jgi:hypothetical protein
MLGKAYVACAEGLLRKPWATLMGCHWACFCLSMPAALCHPLQAREQAVAAREAAAAKASAALVEQQDAAAQELARLDAGIHESLTQLRDIEADYLTGTQQVAQMHQEV